MNKKTCIVYTHHKLGDLIWQLPYIKAISEHHNDKVDLIVRKKTQAQNILKDLNHINKIYYNEFRKGLTYWIDVFKLKKIFNSEKYDYVYILDKVNKPAIAAKLAGIPMVLLEDGYTEKNIQQIHKDHLIKDFTELKKIIQKYLSD